MGFSSEHYRHYNQYLVWARFYNVSQEKKFKKPVGDRSDKRLGAVIKHFLKTVTHNFIFHKVCPPLDLICDCLGTTKGRDTRIHQLISDRKLYNLRKVIPKIILLAHN